MWMTDWKILGANLGIDFEVPVIYKEASYKISSSTPGSGYNSYSVSDEHFGLGDIKLEPLLLSWHWKHFDAMTAYALWVPTGEFSAGSLVNLGDDEWTHMITLGGVWYPADKNSWAVSILQHYEFNSSQVGAISSSSGPGAGGGYAQIPSYQKIPCSVYTLEWGISKTVLNNTDAGLFGYYQKQFTDGSQATTVYKNSEVAGIGPEISTLIPLWNLSASLRYAYEFSAYNRPQGQTLNLTLTKKF